MAGSRSTSLTRRDFLGGIAVSAATAILAACGGGTTATDTPKPAAAASGAAPTSAASAPTTSAASVASGATTGASTPAAAASPKPASSSGGAVASQKDTLVYGIQNDPTNLDPHVTVDGGAILVMGRSYGMLVELKPGVPQPGQPIDVVPDLAEKWDVSSDGLTYTFSLRQGLKFSDGTPLDAKAVKFSFDRLMAIKKSASTNIPQLKQTDAVDATTVKMTLSEPFAYFLPSLGIYAAGIINPKVMEKDKNGDMGQEFLANNVMGSGPYVLGDWQRGQQITLNYNPNWYGKEPAIKKVIFKEVPEATNLASQMEKGDLDFMIPIATPQTLPLMGKPGVNVQEVPSFLLSLAYLNNTKPPLDNVKVRQAMNYAINYDEMIQQLLKGKGRRLRGPLAFGMEGYDESLKGYDYDVNKAKQLLKDAGMPNGFDLTLTYASEGAPGADDVAQASQAYLSQVGIKVKIEKVAEPTRRERIDKGDFVWSVGGWTPPLPIPPWTMSKWYDSANKGIAGDRAFYSNPKVDDLIRKAPTILDAKQRIAMYQEAQKIVVDDAPYILYSQANQLIAMRDTLQGFEIKPGGSQYLSFERLSKG